MLSQSIRLGTILGIPVGVNYSWFIIFFLITASLTGQYAFLHPDWTTGGHITFGVLTSLLFFASVLLHELGHSVLALRYGIPVRSITLFVFGGVAQIGREPDRPIHEFNIAIAGPIVSALLSAAFFALAWLVRDTFEGIASLGLWLGRINLILAVFNLVPGFPLDGGRILRAVAWRYTGSFERATVIAAGSGQFFAYGFIALGIWQALSGNVVGGLWIGFIGWFLLNAAQMSTTQMRFRAALEGIRARDVMAQDCQLLGGDTSVAELVEQHLLRTGSRCTMVTDGGRFRGLVTLNEVTRVPKDEWAVTPLEAIMTDRVSSVSPETPIDLVLQKMSEENINQVPVVDGDRLVGVIGRDRLLAIVQAHLALRA